MLRLLFRIVAKASRTACPSCGERVPLVCPRSDPEPWSLTQHCRQCGWAGSVNALLNDQKRGLDPMSGTASEPAAVSGFAEAPGSPATAEFLIPRSSRAARIAVFIAIFWNGFAWIFAMADMSGGRGGTVLDILFPALGILAIIIALRLKLSRRRLLITEDEVLIERKLLWSVKQKRLRRNGILAVDLTVFYTLNYKPVFGLEIRGHDGKLRFGSSLPEGDKHALCAVLRRLLLEPGIGDGRGSQGTGKRGRGLTITEDRGRISMLSPPRSLTGGVVFAFAWLGFVAVFACVWFRLGAGIDSAGGVWDLFQRMGTIFATGVMSVMGFAGMVMLHYFRSRNGEVTTLEANASGIEYVRRRGRREQRVLIPRAEVRAFTRVVTMRVNDEPRWCGEIVTTERIYSFGHEAGQEAIDAACAAMTRVLGIPGDGETPAV